ncbi:MAG: hypothetical protein Q9203_007142, partial [Teloschistes exilis]
FMVLQEIFEVGEKWLGGPFVDRDGITSAAIGGGGFENDVGDLVLGEETGGRED